MHKLQERNHANYYPYGPYVRLLPNVLAVTWGDHMFCIYILRWYTVWTFSRLVSNPNRGLGRRRLKVQTTLIHRRLSLSQKRMDYTGDVSSLRSSVDCDWKVQFWKGSLCYSCCKGAEIAYEITNFQKQVPWQAGGSRGKEISSPWPLIQDKSLSYDTDKHCFPLAIEVWSGTALKQW